jgi:hypothetical protein
VVPAAGNGTMIFTARVGQLPCAAAGNAMDAAHARPAPRTSRRLGVEKEFKRVSFQSA